MTKPTCGCGRGKMSAHDGKCGHCRTPEDKRALNRIFQEKEAERQAAPRREAATRAYAASMQKFTQWHRQEPAAEISGEPQDEVSDAPGM